MLCAAAPLPRLLSLPPFVLLLLFQLPHTTFSDVPTANPPLHSVFVKWGEDLNPVGRNELRKIHIVLTQQGSFYLFIFPAEMINSYEGAGCGKKRTIAKIQNVRERWRESKTDDPADSKAVIL